MKFRIDRAAKPRIYTETDPCILTDEMIPRIIPLRVWQLIRTDPNGRTVDYGLFATEESAKATRDRLIKAYPQDEERLIINKRTVRA